MCGSADTTPYKAPAPAKKGLGTPELEEADAVTAEEEDLALKATGLDKLRIDLTGPAQGVSSTGSGVQTPSS